jgi:hypothetical protein
MAGSVKFLYADDWYDDPKMMAPMENPSELWLKRDHKHDAAADSPVAPDAKPGWRLACRGAQ